MVEETVEAQAVVAEAKEDVDGLKSRIGELESQLAEAVTASKGHQKGSMKRDAAEQKIGRLERKIDTTMTMLSEVLDREDVSESGRRSDVYLDRLKKSDEQEVQQLLREADARLRSVGLDMENSDETQRALNLYLRGNVQGCLDEVDKVIEKKKTEAKKTEKPPEKEDNEEALRAELERRGLLSTDKGGPTGGGGKTYTGKQLEAMSVQEYQKAFPGGYAEVLQAIQEGRIKE